MSTKHITNYPTRRYFLWLVVLHKTPIASNIHSGPTHDQPKVADVETELLCTPLLAAQYQ